MPGNGEYELGYDYTECGVVKLCRDEGCPELAAYLCKFMYQHSMKAPDEMRELHEQLYAYFGEEYRI